MHSAYYALSDWVGVILIILFGPSNLRTLSTTQTTDCNALVNGNTGCGVLSNKANSYGPSFNSIGGGWYVFALMIACPLFTFPLLRRSRYAIERTNTNIKIWYWARNAAGVPSDVTTMGSGSVNPANWGTPVANFVNTSCDFSSKFGAHNIIINLTFCGSCRLVSRVWILNCSE